MTPKSFGVSSFFLLLPDVVGQWTHESPFGSQRTGHDLPRACDTPTKTLLPGHLSSAGRPAARGQGFVSVRPPHGTSPGSVRGAQPPLHPSREDEHGKEQIWSCSDASEVNSQVVLSKNLFRLHIHHALHVSVSVSIISWRGQRG